MTILGFATGRDGVDGTVGAASCAVRGWATASYSQTPLALPVKHRMHVHE